jgi:hypothetical protein
MNEQIANKIISKQEEYNVTLSAQDVILISQALAAVVAAQPEGVQRQTYTDLIGKLLGDPQLTAELIDVTEVQLEELTQMLDQPTELGQKAFNYKHKRWDDPFDLEAVSDETAKEYIPQDEFTLRTYDRIRKRHKSKYEALTAALQPHLEPEPSDQE